MTADQFAYRTHAWQEIMSYVAYDHASMAALSAEDEPDTKAEYQRVNHAMHKRAILDHVMLGLVTNEGVAYG